MRLGVLAVIMLIVGIVAGVGIGYLLFPTATTTIYKTKTTIKLITKTELASLTMLVKETESSTSEKITTTMTETVTSTPLSLPTKGEWIVFEKAGGLYTISSDGKVLKKLGNVKFVGRSPSGDKIAVARRAGTLEWSLVILNPDGTGERVLVKSIETFYPPSIIWSPDGKKIAYLSEDYLYVVDVSGADAIKIGKIYSSQAGLHGIVENVAAWSPDGKKIAYLSPGPNLYVADPDKGQKLRLDVEVEGKFAWSVNARAIAYRKKNYTLYVIKEDGSGRIKLADMSTFRPDNWVWSPSGSALVYSDWEEMLRMAIFDEEGDLLRTVLLGIDEKLFGFSPSGKYLAFWNSTPEESYLGILDLETGSLITKMDDKKCSFLSWSPTEDRFLCQDVESGDVLVVNPEGEVEATIIEPDKAMFGGPMVKWFPNGEKIAFRRDGDLYVINVDGTNEIKLAEDIYGFWPIG